jgi:hypothetical protein
MNLIGKRLSVVNVILITLLFLLCFSVEAQQSKRSARIGYIGNQNSSDDIMMNEFRAGLRELGYMSRDGISLSSTDTGKASWRRFTKLPRNWFA